MENSYKVMHSDSATTWIKILWSVVVIFALSLWTYVIYSKHNNIIGIEIYPYLISPYVIGITTLIAILRISKLIRNNAFIYILAGIFNLYMGGAGLYVNISSHTSFVDLVDLFFACNFLIAAIILVDVFKNKRC